MLVLVNLAFHLFVGTVIFALYNCSYGCNKCSQCVHSFVADSSLLDCCDLVMFFPPYVCFTGQVLLNV